MGNWFTVIAGFWAIFVFGGAFLLDAGLKGTYIGEILSIAMLLVFVFPILLMFLAFGSALSKESKEYAEFDRHE